jgi:hypothetical protein
MAWHFDFTDRLLSLLRFAIRSTLLITGIALAILLTYVVVKICWNVAHYLDRTIFATPW